MGTATTPPCCGCERPATCIDRLPGLYLVAVHRLLDDGDDRLPTGVVGSTLGVSPASVTEMFARLDEAGVLDYEKHAGVTTTDRGASIARELARRQCLVRTFFGSELDAELDLGVGYRIGYSLSGSSVDRLAELTDADSEADCGEPTARCETCSDRYSANS